MDTYQDAEYVALKQKFAGYYQERLLPILQKNDAVRRKYVVAFVVLLLLALIFYPLIIYYVLTHMFADGADMGWVLGSSGFLLILLGGPLYLYKRQVKAQIMPDFAGFFGTFNYAYQATVNTDLLAKSRLFGNFNFNYGDDYFCGQYDGVQITVAETELQQREWNVQRRREDKYTIFKGVCILLEMNKNFAGETVVLQDKGLFNSLYRLNERTFGLQNVRLEDSRFEKLFEVFSSDQIEARYLLTTAFMERMLKLQTLFAGQTMQFAFKDNKLLIAIKTRQNMFEANSFFRSNVNKPKIDKVFDQFYTVFSIIKILKLNRRIGM